MKKLKRFLSLLLVVTLLLPTLAACGNASNKSVITATAVKYSKSGKYTTTVKSKKVDLSGINADNIEVRYMDPSADSSVPVVSQENENQTTEEYSEQAVISNIDDLYPLTAKVEGVESGKGKVYDITFTDESAAEFAANNYVIYFKDLGHLADVAVELPEITLTPDIEFVTPADHEIKLTLTLAGSTFEDGITEKDIILSNAFEGMEQKVVSSSENNLTLQLSGDLSKNDAGAYQWGTVNVARSAIKDAYSTVSAKVEVKLDYSGLDASSLKLSGDKISADLKVYGSADVNSLTKDNVKVEGAVVETAEKKDDNTVALTLSAENVKSVNDFVDAVSGKKLTVDSYETEIALSQSKFYPVFDYVEEDGKNLKLTLKLICFYGSFDQNISTKDFSFSDELKNAKAESVKVDEDGIAELIITVPANGQTADKLSINGTLTVAAGALVNAWGEKTANECSYTRDYSNESLGKDVSLNTDTLLEIQKYTRGKNTLFGQLFYWGKFGGQVFSIAKTVLEITGVIKSEHTQVMEQLAALDKKLDVVIDNQVKIIGMLDDLAKELKFVENDQYKDDIDTLQHYIHNMELTLENAALDMALEKAVKNGELESMPSFAGLDDEELEKTMDEYKKKYLPDVSDFTAEEAYAYSDSVVDYIIEHSAEKKNRLYASYEANYDHMYEALIAVAKKINRTDGTNPFTRYNELCAKKYNFDSQCYDFRCAQRETALLLMGKGMAIVAAMEKGFTYPNVANFKSAKEVVSAAAERIDNEFTLNLGYPASQIKAFPRKEMVNSGVTYISDIAVAGAKSEWDANKALTDKGYIPYPVELNKGTDGDYFIRLGYKTSKNPGEAIKDLFVENAGLIDGKPRSGIRPSLCPVLGDQDFVDHYGDLNYDAGGNYLYLHQDKIGATGKGLTKFWIDGSKPASGQGDQTDLNRGAGGAYLYLHTEYVDFEKETGIILDNDPEYYPFSYVLGAKAAICNGNAGGALQKPDGSFRNWSDEEINNFISRAGGKTWNEELNSAGFTGTTYRMLVEVKGWSCYSFFTGKSIMSGSNSLQTLNDKLIDPNCTYLKLFDYTLNSTPTKATEKPQKVEVDYKRGAANCILSGCKKDSITLDVWNEITTLEEFGNAFQKSYSGGLKYMLSANYAIDTQGKVGQYVPDTGCSYYTGHRKNDERALTIVLSSAKNGERTFTKQTYNKLVDLTAYLCDQYGIKELVWSDDKDVRKNHSNGANVTLVSDYYTHTDAPGGYLLDRMDDFINDVNYKLDYVK